MNSRFEECIYPRSIRRQVTSEFQAAVSLHASVWFLRGEDERVADSKERRAHKAASLILAPSQFQVPYSAIMEYTRDIDYDNDSGSDCDEGDSFEEERKRTETRELIMSLPPVSG